MELVSILVPCRNAAPWLGSALASALDQTDCEVEVIVIDDGSGDGSYGIARQFESAQCRVVRQERAGAAAARNRAFALAQGGFIQYLDADDLLAPGKIARQVAALRELGPHALSWSSLVYLLEGRQGGDTRTETAPPDAATGAAFLARLWSADDGPGLIAVHQWLTTRELIEEAGSWNESLTADDDGEFFARVVLASETRCAVPEAGCFYRKFHHAGNLSAAVHHDGCHRRSALEAACLKARHLLAAADNADTRRAVSRLLTQQIVDAYPGTVHRVGLDFLHRHGLDLSPEFEASPHFHRTRALVGWKNARLVQELARRTGRLLPLGRDHDPVGGSGRGVG